MMGGALGLVSSRAMDHLADSRKRRRKVNLARAQMRLLRWDLSRLAELILAAEKATEDSPEKVMPMDNAYALYVAANRVRMPPLLRPA